MPRNRSAHCSASLIVPLTSRMDVCLVPCRDLLGVLFPTNVGDKITLGTVEERGSCRSSDNGERLAKAYKVDGPMLLNVGGTVMTFPRDLLLHDGLKHTLLAVLLHRFGDWMLSNGNGTPFIDADPDYFKWLNVKLRYLRDNRIDVSEICEGCPSAFAFYHDRFFAKTDLTIEPQTGDDKSAAFRGFMAAMGAFIDSSVAGGKGGSEVLSVCVDGYTVATTDATLDDFTALYNRFTKLTGPVVDVRADHFYKVVDYVRRIRIAPDAATPLPTSSSFDELLYVCEMYGLMEQVYLSMIGKSHSHIECILKSSHGDCEFDTLVQRAQGLQGGLLFAIECECEARRHRFAVHVDGPLIAPSDPIPELHTGRLVTFYSISGAFEEGDSIVKVTVTGDKQWVDVASIHGALKDDQGEPRGKVSIAGGRLWLGCAEGELVSDLRHCQQWLWRSDLPVSKAYRGSFNDSGSATLAGSSHFTATRLEVYQVVSTCPADPILSADGLQALIYMTSDTPTTAKLLYKGDRDGWAHKTMLTKVGKAADLLFVIKDLGGHVLASHLKGQLKLPDKPTGVEKTTDCPVAFYSISGAFEEGDGTVRIAVPRNEHYVVVAGTEGENWGKVAIGGGRLLLGYGASAGDLRRCQQWLRRGDLPDGKTYRGSFDDDRHAILAATLKFTCADMEIYTLQASERWAA
ncbi:unnamed protein product [Vitrella brassicaformis CCMP3155]|uniref:Potassium channel tetramerisation-type BTB domain-containing protein n=1 Tax=Vitrella brassicaformis (strain CCMP3155) TaxID=1169540 RepID=A0A0G4EGV9_VITBC|nr:unnamed protein product [Vitrella brassicaformis CCMP3155]|eukprot:CEL95699.1 unnamed protein product [Vitrella brassicaformis CCMP3155]